VSITGAAAATATLIVNTTGSSTAALANPLAKHHGPAGAVFAALAIVFFIPTRRRSRKHLAALICVIAFGAGIGAMTGCGGSSKTTTTGSNTGTTAGAYTVTVTAAATGVAAQTTQVNVTVN
jgi:peptidoglycan/LPS O-acetylase OafA/YrhL